MRCSRCGSEISEGQAFCPDCGMRVTGSRAMKAAEEAFSADSQNGQQEPDAGGRTEPPAPPTSEAQAVPGWTAGPHARKKYSGWAVASLVLGICGLLLVAPFIGGILAVVFGVIARHDIRKSSGRLVGTGIANWGIGLGIAGLAIPVIALLVLIPVGVVYWGPALQARATLRDGVAVANIYYFENDDSFRGMTSSELSDIDDSIDFRNAPGEEPLVVYVEYATADSARLYVYSERGKKYLASARDDGWRYSYESWDDWEGEGEDFFDKLEEFEQKWEDYNPFD